jgi:hypothetical protein
MPQIVLEFINVRAPELAATFFLHPLLSGEIKSVRGVPLTGDAGSFSWSRAVQALAIFFLRSAGYRMLAFRAREGCRPLKAPYVLEGEAGSPAASLDYAIAKSPQWLQDMFGFTASGDILLRRLVIRSNPERKRVGPVRIALRVESSLIIAVMLDGEAVEDGPTLLSMANSIEDRWDVSMKRNLVDSSFCLKKCANGR